MKLLKYLFLICILFIIGGAIYVAMINGNVKIEATHYMKAPSEMIYNQLNNYKLWNKWNAWSQGDEVVLSYPDNVKGTKASYSWKSASIPNGSMTSDTLKPYGYIFQTLLLETKFTPTKLNSKWFLEAEGNGTKTKWIIEGKLDFMQKVSLLFQSESLEVQLGDLMLKSLENLDQIVQKEMKAYSIIVDGITDYGGNFYLYKTVSVHNNEEVIQQRIKELLPQIYDYMKKNIINISGKPLVIYNNIDNDNNTAIISVGYPTSTRVLTEEKTPILCAYLPNQRVLKLTLKGDYDNMKYLWKKAYSYMKENDLEQNTTSNPFQVYMMTPNDTPNPSKWLTSLYIPIK